MSWFKDVVVCKFAGCNQVYNDPRILPCGKRTCAAHIDEMMIKHDGNTGLFIKIKCQFCHKIHSYSSEDNNDKGFPVDEILFNLMNTNHGKEHEAAKKGFDEVTRLLANVTAFDKERYVIDYFDGTEAGLLQEKEVNLQKLLAHYQELVGKVHERKAQCLHNLKTSASLERELDAIKRSLAEYDNKLKRERLDFILKTLGGGDEDKWREIQSECDTLLETVKCLEDELKKKIVCDQMSSPGPSTESSQLDETTSRQRDACVSIDSTILSADKMKSDLVELCKLSGKQFKLLYRASRDGFQPASFHAKCDDQPRTLTIVKTPEGYIFGGYTSIEWDSTSGWMADPNAFIFSLVNVLAAPQQLPVKLRNKQTIYCHCLCGPTFGTGHDLSILDDANASSNLGSSYEFPVIKDRKVKGDSFLAGSRMFRASEIEVFQLS